MMELIDVFLLSSRKIIAIYTIAWALTAIVTFPIISLGSYKYIIFIDKNLAKDLGKYYDPNDYMRPQYQLSWEIGSRFIYYCIAYPFIRRRASTSSTKFSIFMWWNTLGLWFFAGIFLGGALPKLFT
nr:hypothetical protein [Vibrio tetraodonis]